MADAEAEAACRSAAVTGGPKTHYDAKCLEWDRFMQLGPSPTAAASAEPDRWQLVYELRPLELVAFWLGIPFRPHHPVYAVIYDPTNSGYYTAPACKVEELGRPALIRWAFPLMRLMDLDLKLMRLAVRLDRLASSGFTVLVCSVDRVAGYIEARLASWRAA